MLRPLFLIPALFILGCVHGSQSVHGNPKSYSATSETDNRAKRAVIFANADKWDKSVPIPYILDNRFSAEQKTILRNGIKTIQDNTCLDFEENYGPGLKLEYFYKDSGDCSSSIGDTRLANNANHKVELHSGCVETYSIQHETMHALGFRHTHTRPDRDLYVKVHDDNIAEKYKPNFAKLLAKSTIDLGIPYEYNSILHYEGYSSFPAVLDESKPAITPIDPDYNMTLGGRYIIFNDWKIINLYYKCNEKCDTKMNCQNGGYQNSRKCDECVCPVFHSGKQCEVERNPVNLAPGKVMVEYNGFTYNRTANERFQNEDIPFDEFQKSPAKIIKAPEGTRINITLAMLYDRRQRYSPISDCKYRAVEIVEGSDLTRVGKRFCQFARVGYSFLSESNVIGYKVFAEPGLDFITNVTFTVY